MLEVFIEKLAGASDALPGGDTELLQLYQEIIALGFEAAKEGSAAVWDRHKDALLPVVVKDTLDGCADVQRCALELMSHLAAMAEYLSPFEPQQASLLWSTVAKVLLDEARGKYSKLMALLAIVSQTMGPPLMETCAEMLAPALAKAMRLESAQAREQAAAAAHGLLGDAPRAMKQCTSLSEAATEEEEGELWLPCLLRLCLDDCVGVRAEALKAAKRAVRCVGRNATVAAWVLERVNSGELFQGMDRVLHHHEASPTGLAPPRPPPLAERNTSQPTPGAASIIRETNEKRSPSAARVKHAMMAWAVHLSLADFGDLTARERSGDVNAYERSTNKFLAVSGRFKDPRATVREAAVEAWGMFACTCLSNVSRRQAPKVADISVRPLMMSVLRETDARVRQAVLSSLARCVASFQPHSIKHLWRLQEKLEKAGKVGLSELIRRFAGGSHGADALHFSARMLAGLLPSLHSVSGGHPSLHQAGLALAVEVSPLLSTLQTLMEAIPPPSPKIAASSIDAAASLSNPGALLSSLDALPTWSLIARAWCGLALWAVSEQSARLTGIAGGSGAGGDASISNGGEKGTGKVDDIRKGERAPSGTEPDENNKTKPLSSVLDWLLSGVAPAKSGSKAVPAAPAGTFGSSPGVDNAGAPSGTIGGLAEWKRVLLTYLVRALWSQNTFKAPRGEDLGGGGLDIYQVRTLLGAPVTTSSFHARLREASGGKRAAGSSCPDCAMAENVREEVLLGCCGAGISGERGVLPCRGERDHEGATPRECPLWLTLLLGVLGGRCGRCSREEQDGHRPPLVQHTYISGSSCVSGVESVENNRHPYLPETVLAEVLDLSPGGAPAKLLSSLSRRLSTLPVESAGGESDGETQDKLARRRSSILLALAFVWRAEASRNIFAWKPLSRSPPVADTAAAAAFGGFQAPLDERETFDVSPALGIGAEQRPDDGLMERTADTLRVLLKAVAHIVVRSPPGTRDLPLGESASGARGAAGGADGAAQSAEARRLSDRRGHDAFGAIEEAFGGQAAALWRDLFEARRGHRPGFLSLLKKLAKDCATLALCSAPVESAAESAASGQGQGLSSHASSELGSKSANWGFVSSQSQPTQRDREEVRRRERGAAARQGKSPCAVSQDGSNGQDLAPPPPFSSLPLLAAVTLSLFRGSGREAGTTRSRAWGAGLATLAWVLTSTTSTSTVTAPPTGGVGVAPSAKSKRTPALNGVLTNLAIVRSAVASGDRARPELDFEFPLDEDSLTPVSRFAAVGVSRSWAVQGPSPRKGQCVASHPEAREEIRALVMGVLAVVRGLPRNVVASPGLLLALSPMLDAVLDMPRSSEADAMQSALLDTWNHTFGNLPGGRLWEFSFPPTLLRRLARMAGRAEVRMPPGMALQANLAETSPDFNREEVVDEGGGEEAEATRPPRGDSCRVAQLSSSGFGINVAGTLSAAGARRSFMRQAQGPRSSSATPTSKKRPPSPVHEAPATGSKFVRVVGNGRGGTGRRPTKRAAITTHTSLDGSQVLEPWEDGSQLPDSEPDSVLPEELFPAKSRSAPPPPSTESSSAAATAVPARPDGGIRSSGQRGNEDVASDAKANSLIIARGTSVVNSPPLGDCITSDRRVRPRGGHEAALDSGDTPLELDEKRTEGGSSTESQQREAAAMAAIARESRASTGEGNVRLDGDSDCDSETANEEVGVAVLVEEARRLARSLEAAKRSMSIEQLEEVDSLLSNTLRGVRDTKGAGGSGTPAAAS